MDYTHAGRAMPVDRPAFELDATAPARGRYIDPFSPEALAAQIDSAHEVEAARKASAARDACSLDEANVVARADPGVGVVLALDLGTHMGWALRTPACITSGAKDWTERKRETRGDRLLRLWRWLHQVHGATPLALVAYELVQHMGTNQRIAAHCYAQFQGVVLMFAARNGIAVKEIHTTTLKKATTGRGSFPKGKAKAAMMDAITARGYTPATQDECDALCVLEWAIR